MGLPGPAGPVGPPGEDGDKVRRAEKAPPRTTLGPAGQRPWVRAGAVTVDKGVQCCGDSGDRATLPTLCSQCRWPTSEQLTHAWS